MPTDRSVSKRRPSKVVDGPGIRALRLRHLGGDRNHLSPEEIAYQKAERKAKKAAVMARITTRRDFCYACDHINTTTSRCELHNKDTMGCYRGWFGGENNKCPKSFW